MKKSLCSISSSFALVLLAGVASGQTPATSPHWSTYLGGTGHDLGAAVRLGPGGLVTVAGTTMSPGLATPEAFQTSFGGAADAFVARFDPSLPAGQQLLWFTYLGGSGTEVGFDAQVDANGVTTVVGLTDSTNFPMSMPGQPTTGYQPIKNGNSDGFVAQIDPSGRFLLYATHVGGSSDERLCGVAIDPAGQLAVIGVTESTNLQNTAATVFPTYHGGPTDAFVARIDPTLPPVQQLLWSTYLGATGQDGNPYWTLAAGGGIGVFWIGNLKKQLVAFEPTSGNIVAITVVNGSTPASTTTTQGSFQPFINGLSDISGARTGTSPMPWRFIQPVESCSRAVRDLPACPRLPGPSRPSTTVARVGSKGLPTPSSAGSIRTPAPARPSCATRPTSAVTVAKSCSTRWRSRGG